MKSLLQRCWIDCASSFERDHGIYWPHLSRATGLLILLNISLFFLNGALVCGGHYWPLKSIGVLAVVELAMLLPHGLARRFWFYALLLFLWLAAGGMFLFSVAYWVPNAR